MTTTDDRPPRPAFLDDPKRMLFIAGRFAPAASGRTRESINPATGAVLATVAEADEQDADTAVAAARAAFEGPWRRMPPYKRQRLLIRLAELLEDNLEEFALLESLDMGAPLTRARYTIKRCVQLLHWYAGNALHLNGENVKNSVPGHFVTFTAREPVGVVAGIIPWNAPLLATVWKVGPVLTTGCTLVLKPAEEAPLVPLRFAELCAEAGVPDGVVNVVTGAGESVGAHLAAHHDVDKVAFTGSRSIGAKVAEAAARSNLKRVTLELGGKSPDIVLRDADLDRAAPGAAMAVFNNTGQVCSAGSRLFVEAGIYDEFLERVATFASNLQVGDPLNPSTELGPLVSQEQLDRVLGYLELAREEGARTVIGGQRLDSEECRSGYFVPPTIYTDVHDEMRLAREEIFGPVLCALPFDELEEVASRANTSRYGLGAGLWTNDLGRAHRLAGLLDAGTVWINTYQDMDPAMPFGGYKESGYGKESGVEQFSAYLNTKAVWINAG